MLSSFRKGCSWSSTASFITKLCVTMSSYGRDSRVVSYWLFYGIFIETQISLVHCLLTLLCILSWCQNNYIWTSSLNCISNLRIKFINQSKHYQNLRIVINNFPLLADVVWCFPHCWPQCTSISFSISSLSILVWIVWQFCLLIIDW